MTTDEWETLWGMLCERFNRDAGPELGVFYLNALEAKLDDEQIRRGVEQVLYENTYWPSPKELVDAGQRDEGVDAEEDWRRVVTLMEAQGAKEAYPEDEERPSDRAMEALASIGGVAALLNCRPANFHRMREAFHSAYEAGAPAPSPPALPEMTDAGERLVSGLSEDVKEVPGGEV